MRADADDLVQELGAILMEDSDLSASQWEHLVIVAHFSPLTIDVGGFAYLANGKAIPTSPSGVAATKKFQELREAMKEPARDVWQAAIVKIEKSSGSLSIDFEYDNPDKWLISPATVKRMAEALRPTAKA
jgi:hypothetical protein